MKRENAAREASGCRHYAMCKIDYAGTGLCPSGRRNLFVSYWPQGLMDISAGVLSGRIPVTRGILHAAAECDLCGLCQGHFEFVRFDSKIASPMLLVFYLIFVHK